ncbi:MAG TPA: CopG family transcriptional regulator [Bacillota bacterium]|nr:CopG family transcriptional regulator [Bacillota bacterium]
MSGPGRSKTGSPGGSLRRTDRTGSAGRPKRSEIARPAAKRYAGEKERRFFGEEIKNGYIQMAGINLSIAEEHFNLEAEAGNLCELSAPGVK